MTVCRSIRFIASAGTGKTHQVVSLYQSLLFGKPYPEDDKSLPGIKAGCLFDGHQRIRPDRILMLTFTKNAAAEMRSRVTEAIERELSSADAETESFCWSLLRQLSSATISTIHSFAQQILAANTLPLGLSPTLTVLEEAEADDLRRDVIEEALKRALSSGHAERVGHLECLCDGRGVKGIEDGVARALRLASAWGLDLQKENPSSLLTIPAAPNQAILENLKVRLAASTWQKSKKRDDVLASLQTALQTLPTQDDPASASRIAESARIILDASKGNWGKDEGIKALKEEVETALKTLADYPAQVHATHLLETFLGLAGDCARILHNRKKAQGVVDFDDLLFKAKELITGCPNCVPSFDVIIIDEAQDNSRLQNDLIQLVQSASGAAMILCGDTKQTIYGWRGADVDGLPRFAKAMKLDDVPLRTSYRSQKGILDWVNDIFAGVILGIGHYGENETLIPCAKAQALKGPSVELMLPDWEFGTDPGESIGTGKAEPKPRLCLTRKDVQARAAEHPDDTEWQTASEQVEQAIALEARSVARRIRLLTTAGAAPEWHPDPVWNSNQGTWIKAPAKPYQLRDILILLRATTHQEIYEQALQEEGIAFTTDGKGRGFYSRQETLDVANLLSWLAFPNDRLAWLGLLRSPFIALSDNAVALIEQSEAGWDVQLDDPTDAAALNRAKPILARLRSLAGRISAVELVREAVRLTGYDAILSGTFHGIQRLANLQKLLSWIQTRERDETLNLQETASRLSAEITLGRESADAAVLDPDDDSVRINTVHAAKGLSSPVVIIPDLRRSPQPDRDWMLILHDKDGQPGSVAGKIKRYDQDEADELETALFKIAKEENLMAKDQEARRLFYVACTRARDLLILSGENAYNGNKDAWRSWINQHLMQCNFDRSLVKLRPYSDIENAWKTVAARPVEPQLPPSTVFLNAAITNRRHQPERYRLPVTAVVLTETPAVRLSLAPVGVAPVQRDDQESSDPVLGRAERGTLAHRILETLDYDSGEPLSNQLKKSPEWLKISMADRKQVLPRLEAAVRSVTHLLSGADPKTIIRELPFSALFRHQGAELILDGKVDLLFLKDGIWHIVDYKFSNHDDATLARQYALQLAIYRDALSIPTGDAACRKPRFVTTVPHPAPFKLILLGINDNGICMEIDLTRQAPVNMDAALITTARTLHV